VRKYLVRGLAVTGVIAAQTVLFTGPAHAVTSVFKSGDKIVVNAGEFNNTITINQSGGNIVITDTGDVLSPGLNCFPQGNAIACPLASFDTVVVNAGAGNDRITKNAFVRGELKGESGSDTILGGNSPGANVLDGGSGNDFLIGGLASDSLIGGPGNDDIRGGGGSANDNVQYPLTGGRGITVTIDDVTNDGVPGVEADNVHSDVETVFGTQFNDQVTGNAGRNIFSGSGGDDVLFGRAGDDTLSGGAGRDTLVGEEGRDLLEAKDGIDNDEFTTGGPDIDTCNTDFGDRRQPDCELGQSS
jgi:Ca2+-binding RTX toxin-like protein